MSTTQKKRQTLSEHSPDLLKEWDYSKNQEIDPNKVSAGSAKSAWWVCASGHEWKTQIRVRSTGGCGCSKCNLADKIKDNLLTLSPEIASQLDDPRYIASDLSRASMSKVWWKCSEGHRWEAKVQTRCYGNTGCPYCSGRYPIIGETDLATLRPDLASQWVDTSIHPSEVTLRSTRKVRWRCVKGHEWVTPISYRTYSQSKSSGCPYCSKGRYAKVLPGVNDLATLHPQIASELYSKSISVHELREFSNKKLEWKCSNGHIWMSSVADRVRGNGCAQCSIARTSKIEGRLRNLIDSQEGTSGTALENNYKLSIPWRKNKTMTVDIYCKWKDHSVVIEYDGSFWHHSEYSIRKDTDKTNALLQNGYLVVRVRENQLLHLDIEHENLLQINVQYSLNEDKNLEDAITKIKDWIEGTI